jgi:hypothetical protein
MANTTRDASDTYQTAYWERVCGLHPTLRNEGFPRTYPWASVGNPWRVRGV